MNNLFKLLTVFLVLLASQQSHCVKEPGKGVTFMLDGERVEPGLKEDDVDRQVAELQRQIQELLDKKGSRASYDTAGNKLIRSQKTGPIEGDEPGTFVSFDQSRSPSTKETTDENVDREQNASDTWTRYNPLSPEDTVQQIDSTKSGPSSSVKSASTEPNDGDRPPRLQARPGSEPESQSEYEPDPQAEAVLRSRPLSRRFGPGPQSPPQLQPESQAQPPVNLIPPYRPLTEIDPKDKQRPLTQPQPQPQPQPHGTYTEPKVENERLEKDDRGKNSGYSYYRTNEPKQDRNLPKQSDDDSANESNPFGSFFKVEKPADESQDQDKNKDENQSKKQVDKDQDQEQDQNAKTKQRAESSHYDHSEYGGSWPINEKIEESYIDTSDPSNPKQVNLEREVKSHVGPNFAGHVQRESKTSRSLNGKVSSSESSTFSSSSVNNFAKPHMNNPEGEASSSHGFFGHSTHFDHFFNDDRDKNPAKSDPPFVRTSLWPDGPLFNRGMPSMLRPVTLQPPRSEKMSTESTTENFGEGFDSFEAWPTAPFGRQFPTMMHPSFLPGRRWS